LCTRGKKKAKTVAEVLSYFLSILEVGKIIRELQVVIKWFGAEIRDEEGNLGEVLDLRISPTCMWNHSWGQISSHDHLFFFPINNNCLEK
jgi:hypothetical protein